MNYEKLLKMSWNLLKKDIWTYVAATLILTFGSLLLITAAPLGYGYYLMIVKSLRNENLRVTDIFEGFRLNNFFRSWVTVLIFLIPFLIAIFIHAALVYLVLFFWMYAIPLLVIKGYGGVAACKESARIALSNPVETMILLAMNLILPYIGVLALLVGILITTPFLEIFTTSILFELTGEKYTDEENGRVEMM